MITGAKEYIETAEKKFEGIQGDIAELEKGIAALESKIDTENEFKIATIKKNKTIQSEINMLKTALANAYKKHDEIRRDNGKTAYSEVTALINAFKREQRNSTNKKNLAIIQKMEEIRTLRAEIIEQDKAIQGEINAFINQAQPFLDPEPKPELILYGQPVKQYEHLLHANEINGINGTTFVNEVKEYDLGITGGLYEVNQTNQSRLAAAKARFMQ